MNFMSVDEMVMTGTSDLIIHCSNLQNRLKEMSEQEPVGKFWTNGNGKWIQDTAERRIKGPTEPLYAAPVNVDNLMVEIDELKQKLVAARNMAEYWSGKYIELGAK